MLSALTPAKVATTRTPASCAATADPLSSALLRVPHVLATSARRVPPAALTEARPMLSDREPPLGHMTVGSSIGRGVSSALWVLGPRILEQAKDIPRENPAQLERMIDDGTWPDYERLFEGFAWQWAREYARSFLCVSLHRILDALAVAKLSPEAADRLMRNLKLEAKRGTEKGRVRNAMDMVSTAFYATILGTVSVLVVNHAFIVRDIFFSSAGMVEGRSARFARASKRQFYFAFTNMWTWVFGSAVGTLLWPGFGTDLGPKLLLLGADAPVLTS